MRDGTCNAHIAGASRGIDFKQLAVGLEPIGQACIAKRDQGIRGDSDLPVFFDDYDSCHEDGPHAPSLRGSLPPKGAAFRLGAARRRNILCLQAG